MQKPKKLYGLKIKGGGKWGEGVCRQRGIKRGKWDNCNSIINKIYQRKEKQTNNIKLLIGLIDTEFKISLILGLEGELDQGEIQR